MAKANEQQQLARLIANAPEAVKERIKRDLAGTRAQEVFRSFKDKTLKQLVEGLPKEADWAMLKDTPLSIAMGAKKRQGGGGGRGATIEVDEDTETRIYDVIKKGDGLKKAEIAKQLPDIEAGVLDKALRLLRDKKKTIKMTGTKATAKYTAK